MSTVYSGHGTLLQHGVTSGGSTTYTTIAERVSITGPSMSVGEADATSLDDDEKRTRGTILDVGELGLQIWYDPAEATHTLFTTSIADPTHPFEKWKLIFNTDPDVTLRKNVLLEGWVKAFTPGGMEVEGNLSADISIRMTKKPVWS